MSSSTPQPSRVSAAQPPLMIPDDLIDPTRAAALRFSRFPVVDTAARSLAVAIVDQYVTRAWLDKLTLNRDMPRAVLTAVAHASRQLEERVLLIPWHSVLLVDLPTLLGNHYAAFAGARAAVAVSSSSSSVLHQPPPAPKSAGGLGGSRGRGGKQASHATQTSSLPSSAASHSSISSTRQAQALQVPSHSSRTHVPPQLTSQSGSAASLAPSILPSTPTQQQAPPPLPPASSATASPGWPTASTPVDQFTPTDAKFSLLMPHIALEPGPDPSTAPTSPLSPPSATLPGFNDYLRTVAGILLDAFLPASTLEAEAERVLMREIVAGVLGMVIEAMSDPVMLLRAITAAFEASSQRAFPSSQQASSSSAAPSPDPQQSSSSTPPRATNNHSSQPKPSPPSHPQQSHSPSTQLPHRLTFSSATLHAHWTRVLSASQWTWYQATLLWHTLVQRVRSSPSSANTRPTSHSSTPSPWTRPPSSTTRSPSTRRLVHQADAILFNTLDQLLHLTHNPATRPWTLLWHLWLRPPIRFLFGTWVDTYLHVAVMYPWNAKMVARMVAWITENVVLKPPSSAAAGEGAAGTSAPPQPQPDMHQLLVQCVDAIVLATGTPALRPVLTDHTLRAIASRYRNRQLVVRIVDVLVAQVVAAGARATAAAAIAGSRAGGGYQSGGNSISPGADALLLTGRRRGGGSRSGSGVAPATAQAGGHRHHHSVSGSIVATDGRVGGASKGGPRRSSDAATHETAPSSAGGAGSGAGALLASSATATATATSVVASMATLVSPSVSSSSAMRHRRSRSTGGTSNLGTSRLAVTATTNATSSPTRASGPVPSAVGRRQSVTAELVYRESGPLPPVPPLPRAASAGPSGSVGVSGGSPRVLDGDRRRRRE